MAVWNVSLENVFDSNQMSSNTSQLVKMALMQKTEKSTAVKPLNSTVEQTVVKFEEPSTTSQPVAHSQEQKLSNRKRTLSQKSDAVSFKKALLEVRKFSVRGFRGEECRQQKEQIAVTLGAKPPKRPYVNYKELKVVRQLEKAKERERKTIKRMLTSKKRRKNLKKRRRL
ncbi:hypothetical protein T4E_5692 [Trichinella pseudospiralis]|uniref:Uncharacterized protein n=1 Tax=Trichinella pseudospiralis TaxID=6337 RepID=A0A0V0YG30_TRIPS|nr:hypothetical protein T4E_5692 [Trichinella pseudospiralis]KRY90879.1 hypothetical protein T4D_9171 [Trichinella pseudospiralis]